jgi:hypothetical protein
MATNEAGPPPGFTKLEVGNSVPRNQEINVIGFVSQFWPVEKTNKGTGKLWAIVCKCSQQG